MKVILRVVRAHDEKLLNESSLDLYDVTEGNLAAYVENFVRHGFPMHGYNPFRGYWWGRHHEETHINRVFVEP